MGEATDLAVRELKHAYREALNRAKAYRKTAAAQSTPEQAAPYREQARFEAAKALGYLKQAKAIRQMKPDEKEDVA